MYNNSCCIEIVLNLKYRNRVTEKFVLKFIESCYMKTVLSVIPPIRN